jgi:hypothetical protein
MASITYLTKSILKKANQLAIERGYNASLSPEFVESLDDRLKFPVTATHLHAHKCFKQCEEHMRVVFAVSADGQQAMVDCPLELYRNFPVWQPTRNHGHE